jgi:subtilisin family serine protease
MRTFAHAWYILCVSLCVPGVVFGAVPNDPLVSQWAFEKTNVFDAWDVETGSRDVVVAVIDNGFDSLHPDIRGNVWQNTDEIADNKKDDDNNGYIDDVWGWNFVAEDINNDGEISASEKKGNNDPRPNATGENSDDSRSAIHHGTVVAGLIGATGNNQLYGSGVAWRVRLMNVKVATNGGTGSLSDLPQGILYAVDNGADIINLSLVGYTYPDGLVESLRYAKEKGVLVVVAAGNNSADLDVGELAYPVCADGEKDEQLVLGVTAVREDRRLARFSNVGGSCIDMAAPGVGVSSTMRFSPTNGFREGYGGNWNGTSFAAPMVSGAAALVQSIHPSLNGAEIRDVLLSTVSKTPTTDEVMYKKLFGAGFLDVAVAVQKAQRLNTEKKEGGHVLIDRAGRVYTQKDGITTVVTSSARLKNVDDVVVFSNTEDTWYASVKWVRNRATVSLFSSEWKLIRTFSKTLPVRQRIALADLDYDGVVDILLSPQDVGDTVLARVYTQRGVLKQTILPQVGELRGGVSVAVQRVNDKNELHVWYAGDDGVHIDTMNETGGWVQTRRIETTATSSELLVVGSQFLTVSSPASDQTILATYDNSGVLGKQTILLGGFSSPVLSIDGTKTTLSLLSTASGATRAYVYPALKREALPPVTTSTLMRGNLAHILFAPIHEM